jgi:hypothetical protein
MLIFTFDSNSRLCYRSGQFTRGLSHLAFAQELLGHDPTTCSFDEPWTEKMLESMRLHHLHACIGREIGDFQTSLNKSYQALDYLNRLKAAGQDEPSSRTRRNYLGGIANSLNGLGRDAEAENFYAQALQLGEQAV